MIFQSLGKFDDLWHLLILQTAEYERLCRRLPGGKFIHHCSNKFLAYFGEAGRREDSLRNEVRMHALYVQNFGKFDHDRVRYWRLAAYLVQEVGWTTEQLNDWLTHSDVQRRRPRQARLTHRLLILLRRPVGRFDTELLGVLGVQALPAELHGVRADDAAEGSSAEKMIQNIEANVPPGSTHRDETAIDVVPQRQTRAAADGFEFPPDIVAAPVVLKHPGSVGSPHGCFGYLRPGRSHRGEFHRGSDGAQAPIGLKGSPLAQMRRVGQRLPDFFRRVAQFPDKNERPFLFPFCSRCFCIRAPLAGPGE